MYLKKIQLNNFRKFRTENNVIEFVDAESIKKHKDGKEINIAPITTLIVGKNNSGKTTVTTAIEKLTGDNNFNANDFNFYYLKDKLEEYQENIQNPDITIEPPCIEFKITIGIEDKSKDLVTNIIPFMNIGNTNDSEIDIIIKYKHKETQQFRKDVTEILNKKIVDSNSSFKKFLNLIKKSDYKIEYHNNSSIIKQSFKLKNLIEIRSIKANNVNNEKCLSRAFTKIVEYRYKSLAGTTNKEELEIKIEEINHDLSSRLILEHTADINNSLNLIESPDKLEMSLTSDITFNKLMTDFIKYEYIESGQHIPETQFGLGYTNLMMIIADLIEYMEKYPDGSFNSKVNLISIEEPETFMHPQMQELFIKHINNTISSLLKSKRKNVNSQLIITTHSSHILNSKIHSGDTFNNINYVTNTNNSSHVVPLNDEKITPKFQKDKEEENLMFLKKHIKYKVSELFFSDAVIFVEGITEETLLRFYIDNDKELYRYYISIFNIDGAHGLVYRELIALLKIPVLILTDLDIKRNDKEKEEFIQIRSLKDRLTTNKTITHYNNNNSYLKDIPSKIEEDNIRINYQDKNHGYFPTSFEEAYILTNYNNTLFQTILKELKPNITKAIIGEQENFEKLKENSYKLQRKLSSSKSDFANKLLYNFINNKKDITLPILPDYITSGVDWLAKKIKA